MFDPLQSWSVGPLTLSVQLVFLFLAVAAGYAAMYFYLKKQEVNQRAEIQDNFLTAVVIGAVIFKLWPFILNPALLLTPRNLMYYMGGPYAIHAVLTAIIIFLLIQTFRKKWEYHSWDSFFTAVVTALCVYTFFVREYGIHSPFSIGYTLEGTSYHPVNYYQSWLFFLVISTSLLLISSKKKYARSIVLLLGIAITYYLTAPFQV